MHLSQFFSATVALSGLLTAAASPLAVRNPDASVDLSGFVWGGVAPINRTASAAEERGVLGKRDTCYRQDPFSAADMRALKARLQGSRQNEMVELKHGFVTWWDQGSVKLCVYNNYIFENTHLKWWEAGWAVGYIDSACCSSNSQCGGGTCTCHGDSGLSLEAKLRTSVYGC
ncbi:hypothetical protein B0T25DRAFT_520540 [Lasiosphaeria hispida]|uniref:Uncharacterized protein n=1 Tax=Lasiosphaeria hispida TaxID=260671 RepID=A0AAJ0MAN3_9PEZI|nr:hypothetical protein B0T25DRAFT_520540 [Lasiosphaeria hispida]